MSQGKPRKKWLLEQAKKDHNDITSYGKDKAELKKVEGFDSYWELCNKIGKARLWSLSVDDICEEMDKIIDEKFA